MSELSVSSMKDIVKMSEGLDIMAGHDTDDLFFMVENIPVVSSNSGDTIGYMNLGKYPRDNDWVFSFEPRNSE